MLDESDRMLDMGFREELEAILESLPSERRTHLVSATFAAQVRSLANRFQRNALAVEGTRLGAANQDIEHVAHLVAPREAYAALVNLLLLNEGERCLIFVERRIDATALAEKLSGDGFPVQSFSGDLPQAQRTRTINAFRDGTMRTLVSTDVAARGIDVPNIELVIHMDPPESAETYVHRSGRTGRAGRAGRSVLLVPPKARAYVTRVLGNAKLDVDWQPPISAKKVSKLLRKRFRQGIHERLATDDGPSQRQIDYAKKLLEGRDPAVVVGLLLEMAQPSVAREPMEVSEAPAFEAPARTHERDGRFVSFTINWGERGGAAPNRLLGHVCRRGQISGNQVGAIKIGPESSRFDVEASVAGHFEKHVRKPDPRDPKLRITRASGRAPESASARPTARPAGRRGGPPGKKRFIGKRPDRS